MVRMRVPARIRGVTMKITDVLILGPDELKAVCDQYPDGKIDQLSSSDNLIQQYRITVEVEDEEDYYNMLLDNSIAMSSHNFYNRVKVDKRFAERIKKRNLESNTLSEGE